MNLTLEIALFLFFFVVALVLFSIEWFSADVTALGLLMALILSGLLDVDAAFAGFGSQTVLMILGLLILTETLIYTGLADVVGRWLLGIIGGSQRRLTSILLIFPSLLSMFISNTASTAFFLPITLGVARRSKISPSRLLMPLAFATILAGSVTLIGTSTNLVVSGLMVQYDLEPLGLFELTPVGLPILIIGLIYMLTIGQRLIPDRFADQQAASKTQQRDIYFTEIRIPAGSVLVGKSLDESGLIHTLELAMLTLQRGAETYKALADTVLEADDILLVEGTRQAILALETFEGVVISGHIQQLDEYVQAGEARIAEVIIMPNSRLIGRTVKGIGLRDRYQLQILAVNQTGAVRHAKIGRLTLGVGDVLLVKLPHKNLMLIEDEALFRVLDIIEQKVINVPQVRRASVIFGGVMTLAIVGILPIAVATMLGAFLVFITRTITPEIVYRRIEWKLLILIGSMLAFGQAMQTTGTADYLAQLIVQVPGAENPIILLSLFFLLAMILTQPMSNQAAAAVIVPIAIQTAILQGLDPRPFAIMIALAATASFITPLEPACLLVYGAGRYRFMDFIRVGGILTVLVYLVAIVLVPILWQF